MKVSIEFDVNSLSEIPSQFGGSDQLVGQLQAENDRLRRQIAELQSVGQTGGSEQTSEPAPGSKDSAGTGYDPTIHSGSLTAKGAWRLKKGAKAVADAVETAVEAAPAIVDAAAAVGAITPAQTTAAKVTLDAVRDAVRAFTGKNGTPTGRELLKKTAGVETLVALKEAQYPAVLEAFTAAVPAVDDLDGL